MKNYLKNEKCTSNVLENREQRIEKLKMNYNIEKTLSKMYVFENRKKSIEHSGEDTISNN